MKIENNKECFVRLWRLLERTRRLLPAECKRFCIRNVLKSWMGTKATDDLIWEVCLKCEQEGLNELPRPSLYPNTNREFLRAFIATALDISFYVGVDLKALDDAYSVVFPNSTPIRKIKEKSTNK